MADELEVVVATVAFGLGIDKPNVRFVFHAAVSDSLDSYYQEIGRAGRDGAPAQALLFYRQEDLGLRRFFAGGGQVDAEQIARVARAVRRSKGGIAAKVLQAKLKLSQTKLTTALGRLAGAGAIAIRPDSEVTVAEMPRDIEALALEAAAAQEQYKEFERSRLEMMRGYAETTACRRGYLLNYFGEDGDERCGNCDTCEAGTVEQAHTEQPFPLNSRVCHTSLGGGVVMRYEGEKIVVLFDAVGYKTLDLALVTDGGLLSAA